ncbi:glycosyltransferase [Sphingomonas sp. LHG3406-1]|uniref:glycosyltransferase family 2 protein n=1 Tax=Sphingomonas sp. LHG3406-1 TaxID=2804617 RepID=UPI0026163416|nr:glycosyltransferase [Sphingomonas sp. LHG3406-1]
MSYRLIDLELSGPITPVPLESGQHGFGIVARWRGRPIGFHLEEWPAGALVGADELASIADRHFAEAVLAARVEDALPPSAAGDGRSGPTLSIAICTRNRAQRLARLLRSLDELRPEPSFAGVEIIVVDNGSTDDTKGAVARFAGARHVLERKAGLNFARNRALSEAKGDLIAFLDDDVVVDAGWLAGLVSAWRSRPDAGGFSGLVLPYRLQTEAQLLFERRGGFRRGFKRIEFRAGNYHNPLFPVGAGSVGAGCNMAFDRRLLLDLGGFDEALDTGAPLPGGGDLDIFYRVLRSGRAMVYEPRYAVHHEHRETLAELQRQYWSWGLGLMAFVAKSRRSDPELARRHRAMVAWWLGDQARAFLRSVRRSDLRGARFTLAETWGGVMGFAGEYERSRARVAAIAAEAS